MKKRSVVNVPFPLKMFTILDPLSLLAMPIFILGGILGRVFAATEAGVVAVFYAFVVTKFIYKSISFRESYDIIRDAAITTTMVVGIISVAGAPGWLLAYLDYNEIVLRFLQDISANPPFIVFVPLAIMLVLTMFIESLAVSIILIPVYVEMCAVYGHDPSWFGLLIMMATQFGASTPPVAVPFSVATSLARTTYDETIRYVGPLVGTLSLVMLVIVVFRPLASSIPNACSANRRLYAQHHS